MSTPNVPSTGQMATNNPPTQPSPQQQIDCVNRVRSLVWQLKETLSTLMKTTANSIGHGPDSGPKSGDGKSLRFDKSLEDFFSICNQIELQLKTIDESVIQQRDGTKYVPFPVNMKADVSSGADQPPENIPSVSYSQYLSIIKSQIGYCKQVQEILSEGVKKMNQQDMTNTTQQS